MAARSYGKFTFEDLKNLNLTFVEERLFLQPVAPLEPGAFLKKLLDINLEAPLATEKAKSEQIVAPILNDLRVRNADRITFFSGYSFDVDKDKGLQGLVDFIITMAPKTPFIERPVMTIVEAKNAEIETGIPQCVAEMFAADLFNQKNHQQNVTDIFGAVTTGFEWLFIRLKNNAVTVDNRRYFINNLPELLGVFEIIIKQETAMVSP
jgi:hypothetical protein